MGDGQIPYVVDHEAIYDTFINAGIEEKNVKFAFIVVNKRINTKFIQKVGGNHSSHLAVRQGTVNPISYNVVKVRSSSPLLLPSTVLVMSRIPLVCHPSTSRS